MKSIALLTFLASLILVPNSMVAKDPPPFPGQSRVNEALASLNKAKENAASDASTALKHLNAAHSHLIFAKQNKGSYQDMAEALSAQAIQLLKGGKPQDALRKIDGAIDLISRAADQKEAAGGRRK